MRPSNDPPPHHAHAGHAYGFWAGMKVPLGCASVVAACNAAIKEIDTLRAEQDALSRVLSRAKRPWWQFWPNPRFYASKAFDRQRENCIILRAIAKHKMNVGLIEVDDPHLSAIAVFLDPWENPRI